MATWSKVKQQLETFLAESLKGTVQYTSSSYRYAKDKPGQSYVKVNGVEVFAMNKAMDPIVWYANEQEIKKNQVIQCQVSLEEISKLHEEKPKIPEERLKVILMDQKINECAHRIFEAQANLLKSDFMKKAAEYLASSLDQSINSDDILLNVFALMDRRMGKSRLRKMKEQITQKHPIVQYFYQIRCEAEG